MAESCSVLAVWLESAFHLPTYPCRSPAAASSPRHASPRWARVPSRSPSRSRAAACTLSRSRGKPCTSTYPPSPAGGRLRCTPSPPSPTSALTPVLARGATISRRVETAGGPTAAMETDETTDEVTPTPTPGIGDSPTRNRRHIEWPAHPRDQAPCFLSFNRSDRMIYDLREEWDRIKMELVV